jgi:hypothetical protein
VLDTEFYASNKLLISEYDLKLETETHPPPPNNVVGDLQWAREIGLKLSAGAKLCAIQLLALLDRGKHPSATILYIR